MKVYIVDDDDDFRAALQRLFASEGLSSQAFASAHGLLAHCHSGMVGCVLLDANMPDMAGLDLQNALLERGITVPVIFLTGYGDIALASQAFRQGALDFLQKPIDTDILLARIGEAFATDLEQSRQRQRRQLLSERIAKLTVRELEVLRLLVKGHSSKQIAKLLSISHRTVDVYRAGVMEKMQARTLAELIAAALAIGFDGPD